jgi:hypothetical protein
VWIGKYMLKAVDEAGPGAWRGRAVEAGVDRLLFGFGTETAYAAMCQQWDLDAQGVVDPDAEKEFEALPDFLTMAGVAYGGLPMPLQRQAKVELSIPGISVPLIGYADWLWPDHGSDLKTTWRIPTASGPDAAHVEQVACYSLFHGVPFDVTYVSPKKYTRYEVTSQMANEAWNRVIECANAIRSFLAHVTDAYDALSMFSPNLDSYFFSPAMAAAVKEAKGRRILPAEPCEPQLKLVKNEVDQG